jgi:hypothetical protein
LQPPDPESIAWKVYRNEKYGFEFEYPAIYDEYESEGRKPCELRDYLDVPDRFNKEIVLGSRTFLTFVSEEKDLETYVRQLIEQKTNAGGWYLISQQTHLVHGVKAISIEYEVGAMGRRGWASFLKRGDTLFIINFALWGGNTCELGDVGVFESEAYAHMVTSLRFLD